MIQNMFSMLLEYKYITHHHKVQRGDWIVVLRRSAPRGVWHVTTFLGQVIDKPTKTSLVLFTQVKNLHVYRGDLQVWTQAPPAASDGNLTVKFKTDEVFLWRSDDSRVPQLEQRIRESLIQRSPQLEALNVG